MFQSDPIMRQIEGMTRFLAKVFFQRDLTGSDLIDEQGRVEPGNYLLYQLQSMAGEGRVNEAENLLFDTIEAEPRPEFLKAALDFYTYLNRMPDQELERVGFSREEIIQGLSDVHRLYAAQEFEEETPGMRQGGETDAGD